jgi:elongation factor G
MTDPFVGQLTFFRVYSGVLKPATRLQLRPRARRSASAACCRCTPTSARRSRKCYAGDIAAAVGLKSVTTGDTLCDEKKPIMLER